MGDGVNIAARLEQICEPGGICLSEDAYRQVRDKINVAYVDLGEQNLKNIARPMRAYALTTRTGRRPVSRSESVVPKSPNRRERRSALTPILEKIIIPSIAHKSRSRSERRAGVAAAVSAILENIAPFKEAGAEKAMTGERPLIWSPGVVPIPPPAAPEDENLAKAQRLSIVVLPFANLSGDSEQDYLADGLTDHLTTDLSHLPDSFVIAHSTALTYKGKPVDVKHTLCADGRL
ncbi:MAG TPA: hypothetical protein VJY34_02780 [Roseiarcus sp.]|nr:hypothetical protein [Roseiarcus sp.]